MVQPPTRPFYSLVIAVHHGEEKGEDRDRIGDITVDWVDFTREKRVDRPPVPVAKSSTMKPSPSQRKGERARGGGSIVNRTHDLSDKAVSDQSLQPLLGHFPGPNTLDSSTASGLTTVGRGVVHLFKHAPPPTLIASIDAHPIGESSGSKTPPNEWAGERAEGEDGSLIAIIAVPAWMRPADFVEFIGGWTTCLEGVRMIRWAGQLHPWKCH